MNCCFFKTLLASGIFPGKDFKDAMKAPNIRNLSFATTFLSEPDGKAWGS